MILVDSSVWIDFFRDEQSWQAQHLARIIGDSSVLMGDVILVEVLQGFASDASAKRAERLLAQLETITIGGLGIAHLAARHFRELRASGITIRSTIDTLIATRCIADGIPLLHNDRDFEPFEARLGLQCVHRSLH